MNRLTPWLFAFALGSQAFAAEYQIATGTTAVKVAAQAMTRVSLCVKALAANAGNVYCQHNNSAVSSTTGMELDASEGYCWTIGMTVQDPLWCVGTDTSDRVAVEDAYQ